LPRKPPDVPASKFGPTAALLLLAGLLSALLLLVVLLTGLPAGRLLADVGTGDALPLVALAAAGAASAAGLCFESLADAARAISGCRISGEMTESEQKLAGI
jgi:hypothetical protein